MLCFFWVLLPFVSKGIVIVDFTLATTIFIDISVAFISTFIRICWPVNLATITAIIHELAQL